MGKKSGRLRKVGRQSTPTRRNADGKSVKLESLVKAVSSLTSAALERTREDPEARSYSRFLTNLKRANRLYLVTTLGQVDSLEGFLRIGDDICRSSVVFLPLLSVAGLSEGADYLMELEKRGMTIEQMQEAMKDRRPGSALK